MTVPLSTQIRLDDRGVAWIAGTQVKVMEVVMDKMADGSSPEEIHFQHPNLSLAQIHCAFAYYYENQSLVDGHIQQSLEHSDRMAAEASDSLFRRKLLALKRTS